MNKKGTSFAWNQLGWMVLAVIALVVVLFIVFKFMSGGIEQFEFLEELFT